MMLRSLKSTLLYFFLLFGLSLLFSVTRSYSVLSHSCLPCSLLSFSISSANAAPLFVFPLSAPHLSKNQLRKQTELMRKALQRRKRFRPTSIKSTRQVLDARRSLLKKLKQPLKVPDEVRRACRAGGGEFAVSVYMVLGTDNKPAKLKGALFFCLDPQRQPELFEVPFEGRLTQRVWKIFAESADHTSQRRAKRRLELDSERSQSSQPPPPPPQIIPPPLTEMSAPPPPLELKPEPKPKPNPEPQEEVLLSPLAHPQFALWVGGRLFVRDFLYDTAKGSALLRGGIRYSSAWLPGWGLRVITRPFKLPRHPLLGRLSLLAEYENYQFNSVYIIPNPFGKDGQEKLPTTLNRWGAGMRFSHGLSTGARIHLINIELKYRGLKLALSENPEYLGTDYHIVELNILGIFSLIPGKLWFDLGGGFLPWVGLGDTLEEVGESAQNIGANALMGVRYRFNHGLSLGLSLALDFVFYDLEGEGRSGRLGESARDQIISLRVEAGWMSDPLISTKPIEMSSPPPSIQTSTQPRW